MKAAVVGLFYNKFTGWTRLIYFFELQFLHIRLTKLLPDISYHMYKKIFGI